MRPWIVQHKERGYVGALLADTFEEIEARYPELRVVEPPPHDLAPAVLARLFDTAQPLEHNWIDRWIQRERRKPPPLGPVTGTVKWYNDKKGVGAISTAETAPHDIWVHNSNIDVPGYRTLADGERVTITYEAARQDSFRFRAVKVTRASTDE